MFHYVPTALLTLLALTTLAQDNAALRRKAHKIHQRAFTLDTHADTPMLLGRAGFDVTRENPLPDSRVDFPRMRRGGLDAIFWAVYLGQGPRTPEAHELAKQRALRIFDDIHAVLKSHRTADRPDQAALATTPDEALRIAKTGKRVIFIGVENGYPMGRDLTLLRTFYDLGARYMTLSHTMNNEICDSSTDPNGAEHNGLSPLGEQVVAEMNRLGMMIDVSHVSDSTFYDVVRLSNRPIIASHSGARAICDHPRNLSDDMLRALARNGGVIQLNLLSDYVRTIPPSAERKAALDALMTKYGLKNRLAMYALPDEQQKQVRAEFAEVNRRFPAQLATVKDAVDHIDHIVRVAGIDHVGMGADFDGGGFLADCQDVSQYENITQELVRRGYGRRDIEKIWSGNFFRVMRAVQQPKTGTVVAP